MYRGPQKSYRSWRTQRSHASLLISRTFIFLLLWALLLLPPIHSTPPISAVAAPTQPPLPLDCNALATPGETPPETCVYGYVLVDGVPVAGAEVSLTSPSGSLQTTTAAGSASSEPYFAAALEVPSDETVLIAAAAAGENGETGFLSQSGAQQVDVWLSTECGPSDVDGGVLLGDTTWQRQCSPYYIAGNLQVASGVKLTIEPGVTVRFLPGLALTIAGELQAEGLPNALLRFSAAESTEPGAWGYLLFSGGGEQTLSYAVVEYAGGASVDCNAAVRVDQSAPMLDHLVVRNSAAAGVCAYNHSRPFLRFSQIYANAGTAVQISSDQLLIHVSLNTIRDNLGGGVVFNGGGDIRILGNQILDNGDNLGIDITGTGSQATISLNTIRGHNGYWGGGIHTKEALSYIDHNLIQSNISRTAGGGIFVDQGESYINDNLILDNQAATNGGGLHNGGSGLRQVNFNVFAGNSAQQGAGIFVNSVVDGSMFSHNQILYNTAALDGGGLWLRDVNYDINYNTITHNQAGPDAGAVYVQNYPGFKNNNLHHNLPYSLYNANEQGSADFDAEDNYWGISLEALVPAFIWDWFDDASLGIVDYSPVLAQPEIFAPMAPPTGFQVDTAGTDSLTLSWNENKESDAAGYRLYYDHDGYGYPYAGTGLLAGDSPIDVGEVLSYTLTNLPTGRYYLALTAYDSSVDGVDDLTEGHESWFSEPLYAGFGTPPEAGFSAAPLAGAPPLTVVFTDTSSGDVDTWIWDFGDGGSATLQHPTHTYTTVGVFNITLSVGGPAGGDTLTKLALVNTITAAHADFSVTPTNGEAPLSVVFSNLSSGDYDTCEWDFGDGQTGNLCETFPHAYLFPGTYTVTLSVSGLGGTDTLTKPDLITVWIPGGERKIYLPLVPH